MLKIVLDTVVFVRALINPHSRCGRVVIAHAERYLLYLSKPWVEEILEVLRRPELTARFRALAGMDTYAVLNLLAEAELVEVGDLPKVSRDPEDDKFLATASRAKADYLITEDRDLLVLEKYRTTSILDCAGFIALLEQDQTQHQ